MPHSRQCKYDQRLVIRTAGAAGCGDHCNVLLPILSLIGYRYRGDVVIELGRPKLLPGFRFERPETAIIRRTDKQQAPCGDDWPAGSRRPNVLLARRQGFVDAERDLPCDISSIRIDGDKPRPGRLAAGPV